MSTWFPEEVACPACGAVQTVPLARGVHAARAPEVRDQLFARTFHRIECRACGAAFTGQRALVYTDTERRHWLQVAPPVERPRWPELEAAAGALFERAFVGSPLAGELREGFRVRLVFGLEELREKLVIWRAGLDDRVIECAKASLVAGEPRLARAGALVVDDVADGGALRVVVDGAERLSVPAEVVARLHDDEQLAARFPELFGGRYVALHRLLGARYRWVAPPDS